MPPAEIYYEQGRRIEEIREGDEPLPLTLLGGRKVRIIGKPRGYSVIDGERKGPEILRKREVETGEEKLTLESGTTIIIKAV